MIPKSLAKIAGCSVEPRKDNWGTSGNLLINCLVPIKSLVLLGFNNKLLGHYHWATTIGQHCGGLVQASQSPSPPLPMRNTCESSTYDSILQVLGIEGRSLS